MILFKEIIPLQNYLFTQKKSGKKIGFVPTMGALHNGHLSLINASKATDDITVCSIFVNPVQFNDAADFEKYPITIEQDILLLETHKTDILFLPSVKEIYPDESFKHKQYDIGYLETIFEGKYRPGHFQGVCAVMDRFLQIVQPEDLWMGQKDYQQCMVVQRLITLLGLKIKLHKVPTQREPHGLAMSSRNMRLSNDDKENAKTLYESLYFIKENIHNFSLDDLLQQARLRIIQAGFDSIDYIAVADAETLQPVQTYSHKKLVILAAAYIKNVRLIDNLVIE